MMTESKKRQTSLSILEKLRQQGTPAPREEKMESMFDSLIPDKEGEEGEEEVSEVEYEMESPEQQAKQRAKKKSSVMGIRG